MNRDAKVEDISAHIRTLAKDVRSWLPWEMKFIGEGRHRSVYKVNGPDGPFVLKFPTCRSGIDDNLREARIWEKYGRTDGEFWYAACEVLLICGLPILKMEWVEWKRGPKPEWVYWIDCAQVGYTKDGTLVAYDYAG